ncbi:MAG: dTDP-4-dehydrorhamnose reductase [Acidobacteriota bacterium]
MDVLLIGSRGQLGFELSRTCPSGMNLTGCDVEEVDIRELRSVRALVQAVHPRLIVNAAAYTAVDQAESEPDQAFAVNAEGAGNVAKAAAEIDARVIHLSTDFVFSGEGGRPYRPEDPPAPISIYGASKAEGERRVLDCPGSQPIILRTSWLYSVHGKNFVKTILGLLAQGRELRVVTDQVGAPTWGCSLAAVIWELAGRASVPEILHWSDAGVASWYDFAVAIQEEAVACGLLASAVPVRPVPSTEFPTAARRPHFSLLDSSASWSLLGHTAEHWRSTLRSMLEELSAARGTVSPVDGEAGTG